MSLSLKEQQSSRLLEMTISEGTPSSCVILSAFSRHACALLCCMAPRSFHASIIRHVGYSTRVYGRGGAVHIASSAMYINYE